MSRGNVVKLCSVYVIGCETDPNVCKVGISDDPDKRLQSLQSGSPHKLYIAHRVTVPGRLVAAALEAKTHGMMAAARLNGEWFSVTPDAAFLMVRVAERFTRKKPCQTKLRIIGMLFDKVALQT